MKSPVYSTRLSYPVPGCSRCEIIMAWREDHRALVSRDPDLILVALTDGRPSLHDHAPTLAKSRMLGEHAIAV